MQQIEASAFLFGTTAKWPKPKRAKPPKPQRHVPVAVARARAARDVAALQQLRTDALKRERGRRR
jgi:hypothetical protein